MADRGTFGDNAGHTAEAARAFNSKDSNDASHVFTTWKDEQLKSLRSLKHDVENALPTSVVDAVTNHKTEAAITVALAAGAVTADVLTHGSVRGLLKEAIPSLGHAGESLSARFSEKVGASLFKGESEATGFGALQHNPFRADLDARLKAGQELIAKAKPKSVSIGDLDGWKKAELESSIQGDKTVRALTLDLRESIAGHSQVSQELQIANRDHAQLTTELKGLKQLTSETASSELGVNSSPQLKRIKSAQQNAAELPTTTSAEERQAARSSLEAARSTFEKAQAAAPNRIGQIEGTADKPGLLSRVQAHIDSLQEKAEGLLVKIHGTSDSANARLKSLRESGAPIEKLSSEEDIALRIREKQIAAPKSPSSILTQEERTGIAAPVKPVEIKRETPSPVAKTEPSTKPVEVAATRPIVQPEHRIQASAVVETAPKPARAEVVAKPEVVVKSAAVAKESSGFASVDSTLQTAETRIRAFGNHSGSLRSGLTSLKEYTDSVTSVLKTEANANIRERVVADAVKNLERLMKPLSVDGRVATGVRPGVAEDLNSANDDKKFLTLRGIIEKRLSGIERAYAAKPVASPVEKSATEAVSSSEVSSRQILEAKPARRFDAPHVPPEARKAIAEFSSQLPNIAADAKVFGVRTDGTIIDVSLPSSREAGVTRTVPKRVLGAQLNDLGAEKVLGRNFGKDDVAGFVVVETKRDADGVAIITNASNVKAAAKTGRPVEPIPDQVITRTIGSVPENIKEGSSFLDFFSDFKKQMAEKAKLADK